MSDDPMGVNGAPTDTATATAPGKARKPRQPDPDAPRRKSFVVSVVAEAKKAAASPEEAKSAAISRLLASPDTFKIPDFRHDDVESKWYWDYRIAGYEARIAECKAARDGASVKTVNPDKAKKKIEKIGKDIAILKAQLEAQGIDLASFGVDVNALFGMKLG